jgi:NAD(P)-dependent dehydrogenase (short-subunit alcohol dehydrogenase family)
VVAVTGAASGIGRALARRFARDGARLALFDLDGPGLEETARGLEAAGVECLTRAFDVRDAKACTEAFAEVEQRFGRLDVLCANAGLAQRSRFEETDVSVLRRVMDINFFGAVHCAKAALPALIESRGSVVVTSSIAGFAPLAGRSGYCASKHALHGCFETLRVELAPRGVHVLLVCPSFVATRIEQNALGPDGGPARHPQSRIGRQMTPEHAADAVHRAVLARRRLLVLGASGRVARLLTRLSPALYERLMARAFRSELS